MLKYVGVTCLRVCCFGRFKGKPKGNQLLLFGGAPYIFVTQELDIIIISAVSQQKKAGG